MEAKDRRPENPCKRYVKVRADFELDGNGCERGVYAGRFYYDGFILYSRTYDKGETFHVMSVNE